MIIDSHTHIFPPEIQSKRDRFFDTESAFKLLYELPNAKLINGPELIRSMDEHEIDISVVFGFPWRNAETVTRHNDYVLEMVNKYPGRLIGLCCFDLYADSVYEEVERCLDNGLRGVGELALYEQTYDQEIIQRIKAVMEICRERKLPVLLHTNEPVGHNYPGKTKDPISAVYYLIGQFPDNRVILAHWGGGLFFYNLMKKEVSERLKNVYFDTAASPFLYRPDIYPMAKQLAGIDRILFGSDYPLIKPDRYFNEMETSGLEKDDIKKICGLNAESVFGMDS